MLEIRQETKKDYEEVYKDMYMDQTKTQMNHEKQQHDYLELWQVYN